MAVSLWVPFQLLSLLKMPTADPHKQPEEEWFPQQGNQGTLPSVAVGFRLSSRPDPSLLPQKALSYPLMYTVGVRSNPPFVHMSKWRPQEAGNLGQGSGQGPPWDLGAFVLQWILGLHPDGTFHPDRLGPQLQLLLTFTGCGQTLLG